MRNALFHLLPFVAVAGLLAFPGPARAAGGADALPMAAQSWGGVVRSGPGMTYPKIASLREGDPVTLLARTGVMWNDYEWFKIRFQARRIGYQWGGILCPIGMTLQGTFQSCDAKSSPTQQK